MSDSTTPVPLAPELIKAAKDMGVDTQKMTPEQQARVEAITLAAGVLNEGGVSYMLFASPDAPATQMKIIESHRLSYSKDLGSIEKETILSRQSLLWSALKVLSIGLRGLLAIADEEGNPICAFNNGEATSIEKEEKKVVS